MTEKEEANLRLASAERGCRDAQAAWSKACEALNGGVPINGNGIYHERGQPLRQKLLTARAEIDEALKALDRISWPTDGDYDLF